MAPALYSNPPLADFILSEARGQRSRENGHVRQSGDAVKSGTVLVQDTGGDVQFAMDEGATGNPTIGSTSASALTTEGVYTIDFTSATAFVVKNPAGTQVGSAGAVGTAFSAGGLGFTLTAGSTAAVAGDSATLQVIPADDSFVPYTGTGTAVAILYSDLKAATGLTPAVIFNSDCEVKATALTGLTAAAEDDLKKVGIKVRTDGSRLGIHTPAL
ncbi:head decoration protein [Comamonas sp.]|uniref:head decoration protein n=1 Tax=Comamonas sp. TaxID=34028 RepID=UPI0028B01FC1|nr:head decoration protein [Comamonas sp.]